MKYNRVKKSILPVSDISMIDSSASFFLIYWMVVHGRSELVGYPVRLIPVTSEIPSLCLSCVSSVLLGGKSTVATNE